MVWTQCCVERSHSFKKVSLEDVSMRDEVDAVEVDGIVSEAEMNRMAVIWSR